MSADPKLIEWLVGKLADAEVALETREEMARTWRSGTNAEWRAASPTGRSLSKAARLKEVSLTADQLWDALRDVACTTGRKANCIVMLRKHDVEKGLALIEQRKPKPQRAPRPGGPLDECPKCGCRTNCLPFHTC